MKTIFRCPENILINDKNNDERLYLQILTPTDVEDYFKLVSDNREFFLKSQAAIGNLKSLEEAKAQVKTRVEEHDLQKGLNYKIMLNDFLIGIIALRNIQWSHQKAAIGYFLSEKESNKGYLTKCLNKLIQIGFEDLKLNRLYAHTSTQNLASNKLLLKCGFQREGLLRKDFCIEGQFVDDYVYGLLREDWLLFKKH